jgi:subtilisin family serine protease
MKGTRIQIGAVLLALIMTTSVVAFGMASVGATTGNGADAQVQDTEIGDAVANADGETMDVIIQLDGLDRKIIQAQGADALQAHAESSQVAVKDFAADTEGMEVVKEFWITNAVIAEVDTSKVSADELAEIEGVQKVIENFEVELVEPEDTISTADEIGTMDATYGLEQINALEAWDQGYLGDDATVSVLDTGVDASHPDLDVSKFAEFDRNGDVTSTEPRESDSRSNHGTHVSGTVSGGDASGTSIGVAPEVELLNGLVLDGGRGSAGAILGGMEWSVENGADVISMSLGSSGASPFFIDPVRNAQDAGSMVIAASSNSGVGTSGSPGNVYDSLSVGASNEQRNIADFSSGEEIDTQSAWGSDAPADWPSSYVVPDVAAPGVNTLSANTGGEYARISGTSMATPHVSGAVALLIDAAADNGKEFGQDFGIAEVTEALEETAVKPDSEPDGKDIRYGAGIIDVPAAIDYLLGNDGPEDPPEDPEGAVSFEITNAEGETGDEVTVQLKSSGDTGYAGFETNVNYDESALDLVSTTKGDMDNLVTDTASGVISLSATDSDEASDRVIATMTFKIADDAAEGESFSISFDEAETAASNADGQLVDISDLTSGDVSVKDGGPDGQVGDVNEDGNLDIADATLLQQFVVGENPDNFNEELADVNGDGEINTQDIIAHLDIITSLDN